MKTHQLKENVLTDFSGELLKGDLYKKEPLFNLTALHYTHLADILQTCSIQYLNRNMEGFMIAIEDLVDNSTAILSHNKYIKVNDIIRSLYDVRVKVRNVQRGGNKNEYEINLLWDRLREIRRTIIYHLRPVLMATKMTLTGDEKLRSALNG